jgi:DNA polymerase I-like protein with 3'-5' exonuclease and polymerase domains
MKKALVILVDKADQEMLNYRLVGNIHDEIQAEVSEEHAERFGQLIVDSIVAAGEYFDLRCPLDGEYNVGDNWSETH